MSVWTVTGVAEAVRDWNHTASGSPMKAYKMDLQGADGSQKLLVEWSRKAESAAPVVGQVLEGEIESGTYGRKFKKAQTGGFGARPEDPVRQKRIVRQHSQTTALQTMDMLERWDLLGEDKPTDRYEFFELWKTVMDWLDADVERAAS